jgi:hypothetical protein
MNFPSIKIIMKKSLMKLLKLTTLAIIICTSISYSLAWDNPTGTNSNVFAPINSSILGQVKGVQITSPSLFDIEGILSSNVLGIFGNTNIKGVFKMEKFNKAHNPTVKYPAKVCTDNIGTLYLCGPELFQLTINTIGPGTITSNPAGIICGSTCSYSFSSGTPVVLTAVTSSSSTFTGWSGSAACSGVGTCTVTMNSAFAISASFTAAPVLTIPALTTSAVSSITQTTAVSSGTITSNGGDTVTLSGLVWGTTANPTTASKLGMTTDGWKIGGPWTPINAITGLTANTTYHVRAYATNSVGTAYGNDVVFTTAMIPLYTLSVTKTGTGTGTVTSSIAGINCGTTCSGDYTSGTSVTLTPTPSSSTFTGWSGACTGTGTCTVAMSAMKSVSATFAVFS